MPGRVLATAIDKGGVKRHMPAERSCRLTCASLSAMVLKESEMRRGGEEGVGGCRRLSGRWWARGFLNGDGGKRVLPLWILTLILGKRGPRHANSALA